MGKWWLVTWVTYGSWLPGDPRGFKTWRARRYIPPPSGESHYGEPTYNPTEYAAEHRMAIAKCKCPVSLSTLERRAALGAIAEDIDDSPLVPSILAMGAEHVHLLAKFGSLRIRPTVGRLKSAATQQLHAHGFDAPQPWAKGCHMESMPNEDAFLQAFEYIRGHENDGAVIRIWRLQYGEDMLPF